MFLDEILVFVTLNWYGYIDEDAFLDLLLLNLIMLIFIPSFIYFYLKAIEQEYYEFYIGTKARGKSFEINIK
jgi:hypothetical protein